MNKLQTTFLLYLIHVLSYTSTKTWLRILATIIYLQVSNHLTLIRKHKKYIEPFITDNIYNRVNNCPCRWLQFLRFCLKWMKPTYLFFYICKSLQREMYFFNMLYIIHQLYVYTHVFFLWRHNSILYWYIWLSSYFEYGFDIYIFAKSNSIQSYA